MRPLGLRFVITGQSFVMPIGDPCDRVFLSHPNSHDRFLYLGCFLYYFFLMVLSVGLQSVAETFPGQNKHTCAPYYLF